MYRTKKDVDKHVQDINQKIKSPTERALKGYFIAKLYFQVGDNESARKYIEGYLAEKDSHVIAHKLAGQIYQALKQTERSLNSYKTCYQLDTSQKDVLETICQLLLELPIDPGRTKYWIEQAEKSIPTNNILYRLKEALVSKTDGETSKEFESMLLNEISCRQTDVNLRIRLIRYYQRVGRIKDGYEYAVKCEASRPWPTSATWYTTITEMLDNYQVAYKDNLGPEFYGLCLTSLDSAISLEIMEDAVYSRLAELLAKLDKTLQEAETSPVPPEKSVLHHFQAQFYFHAARLMYKKLAKDVSPKSMKEHHRTLGAALLAAYSVGGAAVKDIGAGGKWSHLAAVSAVRRSVSGHCLVSLAEKFGGLDTYKERLAANVTAKGLNTKISSLVFVSAERRQAADASGFLASGSYPLDLTEVDLPDPGSGELTQHDCQAVQAATGDLNTLVWIILRYYQSGKVLDLSFPLPGLSGLPEIPGPPYNSISNLDANCFVYAVVYGAGYLEEDRKDEYVLPPYIGARLASTNQVQWWQMAGQTAAGTLNPQDKRTLQFGLDAIRCKGLHGLDAQLLLKLGKTYECHALESAATADTDEHAHKMIAVLEARAALYFKAALAAIEKLEAGVSPRVPLFNLFSAGGPEPSSSELAKMRESATFFLGTENMHQGLMEEALTKFKQVKSAYASFYCAEIYRKLADEEKCAPGVQVSAAYLNYLTEARDCLYLTLDRLKSEPSGHALNANIGDLVEEVENLIHESEGAEETAANGHHVNVSNRLGDHLSSTPRHIAVSSLLRRPELSVMAGSTSGHQTPANRSLFEERDAKPSPERLDAQIRQLNHTQENLVRQMSGRECELVDTNKEILDTLKSVLDTNKEILATAKSSNTELKESVKDLQTEVGEVKKMINSESLLVTAKFDKMCDLLQKIADKPVPAPAPAAPPAAAPGGQQTSSVDTGLSEEEKLLLESFGVGAPGAAITPTSATASAVAAAAAAAYNPLLNLQQQQLMMLAAAAQRPMVPAPTTPGLLGQQLPGLYPPSPAAPFGTTTPGGVQLPTVPAPVSVAAMTSQTAAVMTPHTAAVMTSHQNLAPAAAAVVKPAAAAPTQTVIMTTPKANKPVETGPPTNVVISKSDKIPTGAPAPMVSMSVTVPPQHRLGVLPASQTTPKPATPGGLQPVTPQSLYKTPSAGGVGTGTPVITPSSTPNSFQIKMPEGSALVTSSPFERAGSSQQPTPVTTTAILSSIPTPKYSAVTPSPEKTASGQRTPGTTPKTRLPSTTEEPEEYEPQVDFKPVIPLPEEVEVVTGEEDEDILWEDRAKLFRFATDTKEWKERGLGQAKILKNKSTGRVRFLMRREQTLKVCCNHLILPNIKLDKMKGNPKARIWAAQDYADGEGKSESFCIRMKTEEQVDKFEVVFLEAVSNASSASPKKEEVERQQQQDGGAAPLKSLTDLVAAQKAKPGGEEDKPAVITVGAGGGFKFGTATAATTTAAAGGSSGGGFTFGSPATSASSTLTFGTPTSTSSTSTITFGGGAATSTAVAAAAPSFGSLSTGTPKSSQQPVKNLGGFTFTSTPTVKKEEPPKEKEAEKPATEAAKPNIFSGFSFGTKVEPVGAGKKDDDGEKPVLGASTTLSFASLAKSDGEQTGFKTNTDGQGFSTSGNMLFSSQKKKDEADGGDGEGAEGEYEPDVEFQPVVPLPDLVEVKTGEEDEDALFSERSKLFRFASETKEWKERGIGDFKILKNKKSGKIRFLMRREQVLKICCNHLLTADLDVKLMSTSDKAYTWTAQDFAEGELKTEVFCLRFKTPELAKSWKQVVDKCQKEVKDIKPEDKQPAAAEKKSGKPAAAGGGTLADFAKAQKAASWECPGCMSRIDNNKIQCPACETAKPGCEDEVAKMKEAAKPVITIGAGGGFKFGSGGGAGAGASSSGFTFGTPTTSATSSTTAGGFSFKSSSENTTASGGGGGFTFGTPSSKDTQQEKTSDTATVKSPFGTSDQHKFSFSGVKAPSPRKHNESTTSETDLFVNEDEGEHIYFEPVVPLPDKVDVKTGEEDETVLYSQRSKLFRYVDGEWKERGLGDIKILRNEASGKVRLLMRREQVLKICLNHFVTPQLISGFKEKDPKSWCWGAQDYSEGQLESMSFSIRFKTPDIASQFKKALDSSMDGYVASPGKPGSQGGQAPASSKPKEAEKPSKSAAVDEEELFKIADFRPLSPVDKEHELSFEGKGLKLNTEDDAKDVWTVIRDEKDMHILTLAGNTVGIEAAKAIGHALEHHPEFRRAHWKDMFTGRMKTEIPPALVNLTRGIMLAQARLVELDLSDNAFGPVGMEGLITFLKSPSCFTLQELRLNNTGCGVTGGKMLAKLLKECYHRSVQANHPLALKVFVLGRSRQENEGATALAEVFGMMGSLEEVVMPQNGIYFEGLTALAEAFSKNPNLRILNLNDNTFTAKGAKVMAKALKQLNKLEILNFGDCLLKSAGAKLIARALKGRHPDLRELILDSNEIRTPAGLEVLEAVKDMAKLQLLSMDCNCFGEAGEAKLRTKMEAMGKPESLLAPMEDNEEPDEDEDDPDVSDDDEEETTAVPDKEATPKTAGSVFSGSAGTAAKNLFGGSSGSNSLFGAPKTETSSIFGGSSSQSSTFSFGKSGSLFESAKTEGSSLFGGSKADSSSPFGGASKTEGSGSVFGGSGGNNNLFGGGNATPKGSTLFGGSATSSPSIFGGTGSSSDSIFGNKSSNASTPFSGTSIFGGGSKATTDSTTSIFGGKPAEPSSIFGKSANTTPTGATLFGKPVSSDAADSTTTQGKVLGAGASSFASIAAGGSQGFSFGGQSTEGGDGGTPFSTAGNVLFSRTTPKAAAGEDGDEDEDNEAHDPHFEPIVPLPELIDVKTGEEDEQVVFKHRAKVYRHDDTAKEWKERGVGDIKILFNAERGTYRVLLRREQVHKVALNHLITASMEVGPMKNSETALCWYATDYSQGSEQGELAMLAVRFKTKETTEEFKAKFEECQAALSSGKSSTTTASSSGKSSTLAGGATSSNTAVSSSTGNAGGVTGGEEDEEEDSGEEDEDEYDETREEEDMFGNEGLLQVKEQAGDWGKQVRVYIRIVYDEDLYGARIIARDLEAQDTDNDLCDQLIAIQTNLTDDLEWSGLDYSDPDLGKPVKKSFRIKFDNTALEFDFKDIFAHGKEFAEQCGISETREDEEIDPENLVYGVGGD